jgi:hypothetical protein
MRATAAASSVLFGALHRSLYGMLCAARNVAAGLDRVAGRLRQGAEPPPLYQALGLSAGADGAQIKAAYRRLARRYHPDVNPGDAGSVARIAAINHAYETLSDPLARAAYDRDTALQRSETRRRYALLAATTAITFVVTSAAVSLALRWHFLAAPNARAAASPTRLPQSPMPGTVRVAAASAAPGAPQRTPGVLGWTTYHDARFEFALRYPAALLAFDPAHSDANVHTFAARDGRASLRIVAAENSARISLASFRTALMKERYAGATFRTTTRQRHWFLLSGTRHNEVFIERVTFSCDGKSMHGWQLHYPVSQRAAYDTVAKLMVRNYPYGNGPGAGCEGPRPRPRVRRPVQARR